MSENLKEDISLIRESMADCNLPRHVISAIGRVSRKALDAQPMWDHIALLMFDQGWTVKVNPDAMIRNNVRLIAYEDPMDCGLITYTATSNLKGVNQ